VVTTVESWWYIRLQFPAGLVGATTRMRDVEQSRRGCEGGKVFGKLGVNNRRQLRFSLRAVERTATP